MMPKGHKVVKKDNTPPEDKPLTSNEYEFINAYMKTNSAAQAWRDLGWAEGLTDWKLHHRANNMLNKPNVQKELLRIGMELHEQAVANASEVMEYFTSVMRGEIKDQFGLDAPLSERTRAAQELAKRTVDLENRQKGNADQTIEIKLDWSRDSD